MVNKNRVIWLQGHFEDEQCNALITHMLQLQDENPDEDIWLMINSSGGSVTAGLALYDVMNYLTCDVCTICVGMSASIAAFILSSGTPGKRYSFLNSYVLLHQPSTNPPPGTITDLSIGLEYFEEVKDKVLRILAKNCKRPYRMVHDHFERDYYMSSQKALEYGIIDKII